MITIVTCTYFSREHKGEERMRACRDSIASWFKLLQYPAGLRLHISDDDSDLMLWDRFLDGVAHLRPTYSRQSRRGIGGSLNRGLAQAWANGLAFYIQDDLLLEESIDLSFPAALLKQHEDVMAVRIGLPHPDTTGRVCYVPGLHRRESYVLELAPHNYVMTHRPTLMHPRMGVYGPYLEGVAAGECERDFNERYIKDPRLKVVQWIPNLWFHNHVIELGFIEP